MRTQPPAHLVDLLARLKLATPEQVAAVARRASRLAGDLPDFESVWVDALAQARFLTPFQAAEINAGRGESLLYGPYVVTRALGGPHWAECYAGRHVETQRTVRLYVMRRLQGPPAAAVAALAELVAKSAPPHSPTLAVVDDYGAAGAHVWAACAVVEGISAAAWMVENGRFPPWAVLHIAREMVGRLADLQRHGIVHGDIAAAGLVMQNARHVVLPAPGLRAIVRPYEGYSFNDLRPEAYDYLAPERIADGTAPTVAGDIYACGCLWWHLLSGRPPFAGGNSLAKLKAVHAARLVDVRRLAPDVPDALAGAIASCLARSSHLRPQSFVELADRLGTPTRSGSSRLASVLWRPQPPWPAVRPANRRRQPERRAAPWTMGIAAVAATVFVAILPLWIRTRSEPVQTASMKHHAPVEAAKNNTSPKNHPARIDPAVQPAAAALPVEPMAADIVLNVDRMLRVEQLDLKPHAHVRGRAGKRPLLSVPRRGLVVACEDVTFENIDFTSDRETAGRPLESNSTAAIIRLEAHTATFRGCTFSSTSDLPPAAIVWSGAAEELPGLGGELSLADCVFVGLAAVVDCRAKQAISVTLGNSLCVASGPLVRLHRAPAADEPIDLALDHVTTRGDSAVLECHYGRLGDELGPITISAGDSAFAGNSGSPLVILTGSQRPERLVSSFRWTGQGSIVTPETVILEWHAIGRKSEAFLDEELEVAGLVRGELEFAGAADGPPAASRVTHWQVPLRSTDPPGANTDKLSSPRR